MNRRAFGERVTAMQGSLYRVAASYLRGESDRLDAVAETIAKAWERRQTLRDKSLFATWMTRILIRVCVDIQRRQQRLIPTDDVAEKPAEDEKIATLREAIDSLPEREQKTILLRFFKGLTQEQTARILGVSQVQVSRLERRGLGHLREILTE